MIVARDSRLIGERKIRAHRQNTSLGKRLQKDSTGSDHVGCGKGPGRANERSHHLSTAGGHHEIAEEPGYSPVPWMHDLCGDVMPC